MRFSVTSFVKLVSMMAILASGTAIGLSRMVPAATHFRIKKPAIYAPISGYVGVPVGWRLNFLDLSNGASRVVNLPEGNTIECGSASPWVDDRGECQVVGRWTKHGLREGCWVVEQAGIARLGMPSGRVISQSSVDPLPAGRPCWYPGAVSKVLYAASNGSLYQVDFNAGVEGEASYREDEFADPESEVVATPIRWTCAVPGTRMLIRDPFWSDDPRLGGRLIATVSYYAGSPATHLVGSRLWWLQLNEEGTAIVAAEPLKHDNPSESFQLLSENERFPTITAMPSGELALAYLWQPQEGLGNWELRHESLRLDEKAGEPTLKAGSTKRLAKGHLAVAPEFSLDGRFVYGVLRDEHQSKNSVGFGKVVKYAADSQAIDPSRTLAGLADRKD